jgi:hypothetical protein
VTEFRLFLQLVESLTLLTAAAKTSRRGCSLAAAPNLLSGSGAGPSPDRHVSGISPTSQKSCRCRHAGAVKATGSLPREVRVSSRLGGRAATERLTSDASSDASSACVQGAGGVRPSNPSDEVGTAAYGAGRALASQMDRPHENALPFAPQFGHELDRTRRRGFSVWWVLLDSPGNNQAINSPAFFPRRSSLPWQEGAAAGKKCGTPQTENVNSAGDLAGSHALTAQHCQKRLGLNASLRRSIQ